MRSVSSRNFWGGFWGGFAGILSFGLIHPLLLPVGCFGGVVCGFWYQEIVGMLAKSWQQSVAKTTNFYKRSVTFAEDIFSVPRALGAFLNETMARAQRWILATKTSINSIIASIFPRWGKFTRWYASHPMNKAKMILAGSVATYVAIQILWIVPLGIYVFSLGKSANGIEQLLMIGFIILSVISLMIPCVVLDAGNNEKEKIRIFYSRYEKYSYFGGMKYYLTWMLKFFLMESYVAIASFIVFPLIICGFGSIPFALAGLLFLKSLLRIYNIASRKNHWICFSFTLFITCASALIAHPYLSGMYLWLIALCTGCLSGAGSVYAQKMYIAVFNKHLNFLDYLTSDPGEMMIGWYEKSFHSIGKFFDLIFAKTRLSLPDPSM